MFQSLCDVEVTLIGPETKMSFSEQVSCSSTCITEHNSKCSQGSISNCQTQSALCVIHACLVSILSALCLNIVLYCCSWPAVCLEQCVTLCTYVVVVGLPYAWSSVLHYVHVLLWLVCSMPGAMCYIMYICCCS